MNNANDIPTAYSRQGGCLKKHTWRMMLLIGLLMSMQTVQAQKVGDTLSIRFRLDSIRIDMDFDGNRDRWTYFERLIKARYSRVPASSLRLDIYAGASPEGTAAHNRWLGENRGQAIRRLVRQHLGRYIGHIAVHNEAARWDSFYDAVAASDEPWRDEVLRIIDQPPSADETHRDHRELKLRQLRGGKVWPVLLQRYLAPLRSGASAILSWQGGGGGLRDTIVVRDTVYMVDSLYHGVPGMLMPTGTAKFNKRDSLRYERLLYPAWAVKTNLLLWGVVTPNIEVEVPIGRHNRWSLEAEYFLTWLTWHKNAHASQFHNLGLELRYWLGNRTYHPWLHGWHIGMAVAAGYYDWEWKKHDGYQGEYINTYFNIGYQQRWGKHWGLDMAVGAGLIATKYRHYYGGSVYPEEHLEPWDKHLIWHDTGHDIWLGPCHATLSLVYFFNAWPFHTKSKKLKLEEQPDEE